jgi:hypothetical protein
MDTKSLDEIRSEMLEALFAKYEEDCFAIGWFPDESDNVQKIVIRDLISLKLIEGAHKTEDRPAKWPPKTVRGYRLTPKGYRHQKGWK